MQQVFLRKPKLNNLDNKRWSTPLLESHQDQQEQPSNQSTSVSLLTNKLGISREKAERACVATGFRSVESAINWLLQKHDVDKPIRTEFILLLCPDERLNEQIRTFTTESFRHLSKVNPIKERQHLRAFKLSNFFHIPDRDVYTFHQIFNSVIEQYHAQFKQTFKIIFNMTNDYFMLIPDAETKKIFDKFFDLIKQKFESIIPPKNLAHITLCQGLSSLYNLTAEQRGFLVQLARTCIDFDRPVNWTLRLYAREQTSTNRLVYRVITPVQDTTINNYLSLKANDLFIVPDNGRIDEQETAFGESEL